MIARIRDFFLNDLWNMPLKKLSRSKSFFYKVVRVGYVSIHGLFSDKCSMRASSLTYYSLMAIVPFIALIFGIAQGFGFQEYVESELMERFAEQKEMLTNLIQFANNLLQNTKGGIIAGVGIIFLFWSVMKLLGHIESALNDIWQVEKPRHWKRKYSNYFALMLIIPIFLILFSSSKVIVIGHIKKLVEISSFFSFFLKIIPYLFLWGLFTFIYIFVPKGKVRFVPALIGGVIGGIVYESVQAIYILFQIGVNKYGAIYGSFAALPLFLIWLQLSWIIFLFGSEISFASQNIEEYEFKKVCNKISHNYRVILALWVMRQSVDNFINKNETISTKYLHEKLNIPNALVKQIIDVLVKCELLIKVDRDGYLEEYQLNRYAETLKIKDVVDAINFYGVNDLPVIESEDLARIKAYISDFHEIIANSPKNILIKDL